MLNFLCVPDSLCKTIVYVQVPFGNFEEDWLIHAFDVLFSRALREENHVTIFILFYFFSFFPFQL